MLPQRPQLRSYLKPVRVADDPDKTYLVDRLGLAEPFLVPPVELPLLPFFDGQHTLEEICQHAGLELGQEKVRLERVAALTGRLEAGLCLDSPRFRAIVDHPVRPPSCIGCYEEDPEALRLQIRHLFEHRQGAGLPGRTNPDGSLHAALIPHIDYARGGLSYTFAFKELFEKTDASLFVIIGTSHHSYHRFTLTRKNFQTPLGIVPTDQAYIDRLIHYYGGGLFDDEWLAHFPEHSIELEVVFLQYLYEKIRPIRIVPLVVGSFHDCVSVEKSPTMHADIARMVGALRQTQAETKEPICYIISGDLAHIGPKFVSSQRLDKALLEHSRRQDWAILRMAEAVDYEGYFQVIAREGDARNICGLPPTFTTLAAAQPRSGRVLHYDRFVHPQGNESVSFASVAFYR